MTLARFEQENVSTPKLLEPMIAVADDDDDLSWDDSLVELALIAFSLCRSPQSQPGPSREQMGLPHEDCRAKTFPWL